MLADMETRGRIAWYSRMSRAWKGLQVFPKGVLIFYIPALACLDRAGSGAEATAQPDGLLAGSSASHQTDPEAGQRRVCFRPSPEAPPLHVPIRYPSSEIHTQGSGSGLVAYSCTKFSANPPPFLSQSKW